MILFYATVLLLLYPLKILSDQWAAYATLQEEGYSHGVVCHKRNFVLPDDPTVHTQLIECTWRYAKKEFPDRGTSKSLRESYLQSFVYRRTVGKDKMMDQLLHDIRQQFPWKP